MAQYKNEDNVLMMFNRFYHMCKTKEQRTLVLDMKYAFLEIPAADVVPKSECKKCGEKAAKTIVDLQEKLAKAKSEVARAIFEEIEKILSKSRERYSVGGYHYDHYKRDNAFVEAFAELKKKHLERCSEDGWISVSEKLPTENGKYWCAYKDSRGNNKVKVFEFCAIYNAAWDINSFNVGKFTIFDGDCFVPVKVQVTHWRHYFVPEAPNAKGGE